MKQCMSDYDHHIEQNHVHKLLYVLTFRLATAPKWDVRSTPFLPPFPVL